MSKLTDIRIDIEKVDTDGLGPRVYLKVTSLYGERAEPIAQLPEFLRPSDTLTVQVKRLDPLLEQRLIVGIEARIEILVDLLAAFRGRRPVTSTDIAEADRILEETR